MIKQLKHLFILCLSIFYYGVSTPMDQSSLISKGGIEGFRKRQGVRISRTSGSTIEDTSSIEEQSAESIVEEPQISPRPSPLPSPMLSSKQSAKPLPTPPLKKNIAGSPDATINSDRALQYAIVKGSPVLSKRQVLRLEKIVDLDNDTDSESPAGNDSSISPERNGNESEIRSSSKWVSGKVSRTVSPMVSPRVSRSSNHILSPTTSPTISPRIDARSSQTSNGNDNSNNSPLGEVAVPLTRPRYAIDNYELSRPSLQFSKLKKDYSIDKNALFHEAVKRGDVVKVTTLLRDGADVNSLDSNGATAIEFAATTRNTGLMEFLKAHGATIKSPERIETLSSSESTSPLRPRALAMKPLAASTNYVNPDDSPSESPSGSPLSSPKNYYQDGLDLSKKKHDSLELSDGSILQLDHSFHDHLEKLNSEFHEILAKRDLFKHDFARLEALLRDGADINSLNSSKNPAIVHLMQAEYPAYDVLKFLLTHGVNPNKQGQRNSHDGKKIVKGPTALQEACRKGLYRFVHILLEHGADPNVVDGNKTTPLMSTVYAYGQPYKGEDLSIVISRMLIAKGADVFTQNEQGSTAFQMASQRHNKKEMADYLYRKQEEVRANQVQYSVIDTPQASVVEEN